MLAILATAVSANAPDAPRQIPIYFGCIIESCSMSEDFLSAFCNHPQVVPLLEILLLRDPRPIVRENTALIISNKIDPSGMYVWPFGANIGADNSRSEPDITATRFRNFFWPVVSSLVGPAISNPTNSGEVLELCLGMLGRLRDARSSTLDMQKHFNDWNSLLLDYTTFEVLFHYPEFASFGLIESSLGCDPA